jgi:2-polyprenyl-3-methyl-5-hydroxy-6-metoxy-1,4-benzoquinol methylase
MNSTPIRTEAKPLCPFCGTAGVKLYAGLRDRLFSAPGEWTLKRCPKPACGLIWPDPSPLKEDLGLAYKTYYTHEAPQGAAAGAKFNILSLCYRAGIALPALFFGLLRERRQFQHMFLLPCKPGRLLDVGCGDGSFLHRMARHGWTGTGMDFDAQAIAAGRQKYGLDLTVADFMETSFPEASFDAITMSHVIEHVPDPAACFEKCRKLLKPGGRLVVTTPNSLGLGHQRFQSCWRGLEAPRHLHIFSPQLLAQCAKRAGLEVVRAGSTAVNADYIATASLAIQAAGPDEQLIGGRWDARFALRGVVFQYREQLALRSQPDAGEEAFVVAARSTAPAASA